VATDFVYPFRDDVFERVGGVDGECDEDDVGFGVGEGTELFVFFLTAARRKIEF